jgi:hypothetical protein
MRQKLGLCSFLRWSFRDCGCGKAMSFDEFFREDRLNRVLQVAVNRLGNEGLGALSTGLKLGRGLKVTLEGR